MEQTLKSLVFQRLTRDGRWKEAEPIKDRLIREARNRGATKTEASDEAYKTIDQMFQPLPVPEPPPNVELPPNEVQPPEQTPNEGGKTEGDDASRSNQRDESVESEPEVRSARARSESTVAGLSEIPESWPSLPPNASLGVEVSWVLANRIRVIREDNDGIKVDLSKALTPAPSYATLGWLETSIRAFAKFVDVSAKASAAGQDDADKVKREKLEIAEIRELLGQMRALVASK
jgi:hypothetical protein